MGSDSSKDTPNVPGERAYQILGLHTNAESHEVKKAYRAKARETHPDKGGEQKDFEEVNRAYTILSDPRKRAVYDRCGSAGLEKANVDLSSVFERFFGSEFEEQKIKLSANKVEVFVREDILKMGGKVPMHVSRQVIDQPKLQKHVDKVMQCQTCKGSGYVTTTDHGFKSKMRCRSCSFQQICTKRVVSVEEIDIPAGWDITEPLVFDEMGDEAPNATTGDLVIFLRPATVDDPTTELRTATILKDGSNSPCEEQDYTFDTAASAQTKGMMEETPTKSWKKAQRSYMFDTAASAKTKGMMEETPTTSWKKAQRSEEHEEDQTRSSASNASHACRSKERTATVLKDGSQFPCEKQDDTFDTAASAKTEGMTEETPTTSWKKAPPTEEYEEDQTRSSASYVSNASHARRRTMQPLTPAEQPLTAAEREEINKMKSLDDL